MTPLKKYIWLVDTLMQYGDTGLTIKQVSDLYEADEAVSGGEKYNGRTFHRHRKEVKDIFGIEIECYPTGSEFRYRIADSGDNDYFRRWLMDSISINRVVEASKDAAEYISVERTHADSLPMLLQALKDGKAVTFDYTPFWSDHTLQYFNFQPHAVKMFERRWYLIGRNNDTSSFRIYALDRMSNVEIQNETFQRDANFNMTEMFVGSYGIYVENIPIESVWLKVDAYQANYLRSLPLHSSQIELKREQEYSVFSLRVRPSYDFCQKLLSYGSKLEVLKPEHLRQTMREETMLMALRYQEEEDE